MEEFGELPKSRKKAVKELRVYRAEKLEAPESHFKELKEITEEADQLRTDDRQTRMGAIFASSNMGSMGRWIRGSAFARASTASIEFKIKDLHKVYVYPVENWEKYSWAMDRSDEVGRAYWASGVALSDFIKTEDFYAQDGSWEILIPKDAIVEDSVKTVSQRRIVNNTEGEAHYKIHSYYDINPSEKCDTCLEWITRPNSI